MSKPASFVVVKAFGLTDTGLVRKNNEDNFLFTRLGSGVVNSIPATESNSAVPWIFIVADGMGGGQAGEVASQMAVELVADKFASRVSQKKLATHQSFEKALAGAVEEANRTVFQKAQNKDDLRGMGTTITAAAVCDKTIIFAQLGDSRAYVLRGTQLMQMTKDQSLVAQMVAAGEITPQQAKTHPRRNVILQALGVQARVEVAITSVDLKKGDRLVMCSDGLWDKVEPEEIKETVECFPPQLACENLVRLANERGGEDNITVVIASFNGDGSPLFGEDDASNRIPPKKRRRWRFWPWTLK